MEDFEETEDVDFPSEGSSTTPCHTTKNFRLQTFAPRAFRHVALLCYGTCKCMTCICNNHGETNAIEAQVCEFVHEANCDARLADTSAVPLVLGPQTLWYICIYISMCILCCALHLTRPLICMPYTADLTMPQTAEANQQSGREWFAVLCIAG